MARNDLANGLDTVRLPASDFFNGLPSNASIDAEQLHELVQVVSG
jgi:hypothetical protein